MKYLILFFTLAACSSTPVKIAVPTPPTEEYVKPQISEPAPPAAPVPVAAPAPKSGGMIKPVSQIWKLEKGKLVGPGAFGFPSVLSKTKNKKGNGTTSETCFRYATYSVVELRSTDEVGAGELTIRHEPPRGFNLCQPEFRGKTTSLRLIEGYFAGVAGGFILVDGADSTEGQTEFQIFTADSGLEVIKSYHHPTEDFTITKVGDDVTIDFFAKLPVKCELATEGEKCWERVLRENKVVGKTPMPDCVAAFSKTKTPLTEPALVFTRARVTKPGSPVKYLGGKATCQPAP